MASVRWMGLALLMLVGGTVQAGDYAKAMKKADRNFDFPRVYSISKSR